MPTLKCGTCSKTFSKKEHHVRHLRTHTRERPFACRDCDQQFARRDTLKRHSKSQHGQSDSVPEVGNMEPLLDEPQSVLDDTFMPEDAAAASLGSVPAFETTDLQISSEDPLEFSLTGQDWQWDPSFELGPDFNIEDFGTYDAGTATPGMPWLPLRSQANGQTPRADAHQSSLATTPETQDSWFIRPRGRHRGDQGSLIETSPSTGDQTDVDRIALSTSLQNPPSETWLPPTSALNRYIHTFTTKLWHLIPVVHLPSFVAAQAHPLLLLSICSLGALAEGSEAALEHAFRLYEGVQKAILISWNSRDPIEPALLSLIQAASIGQTFAILSPKTKHLVTARSFHGTLCVSIEIFQDIFTAGIEARSSAQEIESQILNKKWQDWILMQTCIRISNAVQCHDGEIAATFQRRPTLRMQPMRTSFASSDAAFLAPSAEEWQRALSVDGSTPGLVPYQDPQFSSGYSSCAVLESILAEIVDLRLAQINTLQIELQRLETILIEWNVKSARMRESDGCEKLSMQHLLHSCFIYLLCDFNMFERFFGRDGELDTNSMRSHISEWAATDAAKRCVVHALAIAQLSAQLRVRDVASLHLARTIYSAGVVLAVYASFVSAELATIPQSITMRYTEMTTMGNLVCGLSEGFSTRVNSVMENCKILSFTLAGTLRSLGPWPNAQRYAKTLDGICAKLEV